MTRSKLVSIVAALLLLTFLPNVGRADLQISLLDLLPGGSLNEVGITVGDKHFFDFHNYTSFASGGAAAVLPATIGVSPFVLGGEYGLVFNSASFSVGVGQTQDTVFHYEVEVLDPGWLIDDATLQMTAGRQNHGRVTIIESLTRPTIPTYLTDLLTVVQHPADGPSNTIDHQVFANTTTVLHVAKDVGLVGNDGQAFLSDFSQTYSQVQVPEPATMALLALGGLPLLRKAVRRRK